MKNKEEKVEEELLRAGKREGTMQKEIDRKEKSVPTTDCSFRS